MPTELSKDQFIEILLDNDITKPADLSVFQAIYSFDQHKAYASQVGRLLGNNGKMPGSPINLQIGRIAKRIATKHHIDFTVRENQRFKFWDIFFNGWEEGRFWVWQLKPNLIKALEETELTGEIQYSDEIPLEYTSKLFEGAKRTITVNSYERNSQARKICIQKFGTSCFVCKFDFEKEYGEVGKGFIHVHHLTPIAEIGESYEIDPMTDLRPVCPNCHSMLHREKDTMTIDELKKYYNQADGRNKTYR
jgi:5-methylcytosine-specific restriction protein A